MSGYLCLSGILQTSVSRIYICRIVFTFKFKFVNIGFCVSEIFIIILLHKFLLKYVESQEGQHIGQFCWRNKFYP